MPRKRVLVLGAGYFGRLLIDDLLRYADCDLIVASRRAFRSGRFETAVADLWNPPSLERVLAGVKIAICAAGPFQGLPTSLPDLCLKHRVHYIDLADDRSFVRKVRLLARGEMDTAICTGWSTVSALSGVLVQIAAEGLGTIDSIYIHMAPGNRGARHTATIASLMHSVGQQFNIFRDGVWRTVTGWSEPRDIAFPQPVGVRRGFLVDVPDHEFFPALFSARTVEFRTSSELPLWNRGLSLLRWLVEKRVVRNWVRWSGAFQRTAALLSWLGHDYGSIGVEVTGSVRRKASIVADFKAERMAVMPASIMTTLLLSDTQHRGLVSPANWLTRDQLLTECTKRGFRLILEEL
jgi:hypothetical protein